MVCKLEYLCTHAAMIRHKIYSTAVLPAVPSQPTMAPQLTVLDPSCRGLVKKTIIHSGYYLTDVLDWCKFIVIVSKGVGQLMFE